MKPTELCLSSIPHTGTHFTLDLFRRYDFIDAGLNDAPHSGHGTIYHGHMLKETQIGQALSLAEDMPLICPLRHPYWVEETWRRRSRNMGELVEGFHTLVNQFDPAGFVFAIDADDKQAQLRRLSAYVGFELESEFPVVHSLSGTTGLTRDQLDPSREIQQLVQDIEPFLSRYYTQP